ncbi:hypothetical protein F7731_09405 [Cytobacillus depressus]|uniref:Uncharacterized protein n=1 Tax=Cytobacillus depressus TaxID=1602942 RepID=A0A6L3V5S3_9BACI|nr:hypothetical protein [Cytobacillus depressus]KAB2336574.1 hypothetical protein F7731_09405 [Cytobacillus depressus]
MKEITFENLTNMVEVSLSDSELFVNRVRLTNAKKIQFKDIESMLIKLSVLNDKDELIASLSVGAHERLLVNEGWSYIERV